MVPYEQQPVTPQTVAYVVGEGGFWSRSGIAARLGRGKTTHVVSTIEIAVSLGYIDKVWGQVGRQPGWVYSVPGLQAVMFGEGEL